MTRALLLLLLALADSAPAATQEETAARRECDALLAAPAEPFAAARLYRLARLRDDLPPGTAEACADRVLAARRAPAGLVRTAAALRARWAAEAGDALLAAADAARAGTVLGWRIAGPFADPRRGATSGGGTVQDAVDALRAGATDALPGLHGAVAFRELPAPRPDGAVDVARAVPTGSGACALLRATVTAPAGASAALLLGGAPGLSVWLAPAGQGAPSAPVAVEAVAGDVAPARLAVPLPRGAREVDVLVGVCPAGNDAVVRAFVGTGRTDVEDARERLAAPVRGAARPTTLLDAADLLVESGALPPSADPLAAVRDGVRPADAGRAVLLRARSAADASGRQAAAAAALVLLPDDLEALLGVVREGAALPGAPGVREALAHAAALHPDSVRVAVAVAAAALADGAPLRADDVLAPLAGANAAPAVLRAELDVAAALGRADARRAAAEALLACRPADEAAWGARIDAAIDAGAYDDVRAWLGAAAFGSGGRDPIPALELARLAARTALRIGDVDDAVTRLDRLSAERPDDETAWFDLGWALVRAGRADDAERALRRGLALRPSDALARAWIAAREPPDAEAADWLAPAADDSTSRDALRLAFPDAAAAYALRAVVVTLDAGGAVRERHHRIVQVLQPAGADALRTLPLASFDPTRTVFRVTGMAVRSADGRPRGGAAVSYSGGDLPDVRLFSSVRLAMLVLPPLTTGDSIDVRFETIDIGSSSLPDGALAREYAVREAWPTAVLRFVAAAPEGVELHLDAPPEAGARTVRGASGGRGHVLWEARELPAAVSEPFGPPARETAGALRVTTFASWAEVGAWIAGLFRLPGGAAALAGLGAPPELPAIYRAVASTVRYVAAEYGSHGLEPAAPALTLARGYGDCKDKTALLVAALGSAGIDAVPTLVRSRDAGADPSAGAFAYPLAFDHVVAWLPPPVGRFVDPTATRLPWDVLPRSDRGALGLVLGPDGAHPVVLPAAAPDGEGLERREMLFLDPSGEASLVGTLHAGGADAGDLRGLLAPPDLRPGVVAVLLARDLPDTRPIAVDVDGLDPDQPGIDVEYVGSVPAFAAASRDGLRVPLGVRFDLVERFASLERRRSDLELSGAGFPVHWRRDVQIGLSGNWSWSALPAAARETGPSGDFALDVRVEGGMLHVAVDLAIPLLRVAAADYPAFRGFLGRVDAALAQVATAVRREPGE